MNSPTVSDLDAFPRDDLVLRLENISVRYRVPHERYATLREHTIRWLKGRVRYDDFLALKDINLQVRKGEALGIVGRNGAGKSTLLKVVARVLRPRQGRVRIAGRVAPLLEYGAGFHPELTGRENVYLNGSLLGLSHKEIDAKYKGIVDFAELWDFIDAPIRTYSSGMIARLGFAVATEVSADILLMDEVFSVGDIAFKKKSMERINRFRRNNTTILLVSHSPGTIASMCDRAIWLDQGAIKANGPVKEVVGQYQESSGQNSKAGANA